MIRLVKDKVIIKNGEELIGSENINMFFGEGTIARKILLNHNISGNTDKLRIKFDSMASHDITYVGIIQTARASGMKEFPIPYVLTNCHNSLCAVGGTINEDDHLFGLSAAKKYGGIYVPAHQSVIHSYMRERMAGCGKMILGSDSHTRYGALGTMAIGEGGPELVKQLLGKTYDIDMPEIIAVRLSGKVKKGIGPHDVALALIEAVYKNNFVKNKVLEFVGSGISGLSAEFRNGIDVMTTETACLSSIWITDDVIHGYYSQHKRENDFALLLPDNYACYSGLVDIDLSEIESMIALPYHPSNAVSIHELNNNPRKVFERFGLDLSGKINPDGKVIADQGVIAGCAGGIYDNISAIHDIIGSKNAGGNTFNLSLYPASQPVMTEIVRNGIAGDLLSSGVTLRSAFCGPCFGAGDVPANGCLSLRHSTRNFPNREGSKPGEGQNAFVALMDARSIAATAINNGIITAATDLDIEYSSTEYSYDDTPYINKVYDGYGNPDPNVELHFGPNITDWPHFDPLGDNIVLSVCSYITDDVTTTDELIPSGETSSYRSNPLRLSEFALSRKDPGYVSRAKKCKLSALPKVVDEYLKEKSCQIGSVIYARRPGDGSAREQAASCQRVLGGSANIALEYATKRYRSNLINWGMIPFTVDSEPDLNIGDYIVVENIKQALINKDKKIDAAVFSENSKTHTLTFNLPTLTDDELKIILSGCLINYYSI